MAINIDIRATLKGLNNLIKVEQSLKKISVIGNKGFSSMLKNIRKQNGALAENNKFLSRSADRVGFMAFQFTFLEGIAQRVLGSIKRFFGEIIREGADSLDSMTRAIAQSGIDFSGQTEESAMAVSHLNDAIFDMGAGGTIFSITEVSDAMREIGKATDLTGTELEKSNKLIGVTKQVLRLMTIEQVDSAESAKTLIKTMNNFGLSLSEAARVTSVMINVNQSSAITLDELSRSFGFASSQARDFGLDVEETGALLGLLGNRLGQGAGAAGRNLRQLFFGLKNNALKLNPVLEDMGIKLLDNNGNLVPFIDFLKDTKKALDKAGTSSDAFKLFLEDQMGLEIRAADALAKLTQVTEEEIDMAVAAARAGDSSALEGILGNTAQANMKKMTNSLNALKTIFTQGLSPAIAGVSEAVQALVRDGGLQEMALELGDVLGKELLPIVKTLAKQVKKLADFFREHKSVMAGLIKLFIGFIGLLVATLIIASVGKVVAAFTSLLLKLTLVLGAGNSGATGAMVGTQVAAKGLRFTLLTIIAVIAGIVIAVFAAKNLFVLFTDEIDNSDQAAEIAVSGGMLALGLAIAGIAGNIPGLIVALAAVAAILVIMWADSVGAMDEFSKKWDQVIQKIEDEDLEGLDAMLVVFQAFAASMEAAGVAMGLALGEAASNWILDMQDAFAATDWGELWEAVVTGNLEKAMEVGEKIATELVAGFLGLIIGGDGLTALTGKTLDELGQNANIVTKAALIGAAIGDAIREAFITAVTENLGNTLIDAITSILPPGIAQLVAGVLKGASQASENTALARGANEAPEIESRFPEGSPGINVDGTNFQPAPDNGEGVGEIIPRDTIDEMVKGLEELKGVWVDRTIKWSNEYLGQADALTKKTTDLHTSFKIQKGASDANTIQVDFNTLRTKMLSAAQQLEQTEVTNLTLETARLTNFIIDSQEASSNVSVALTKLALEGTEAARRLATLEVSRKGNFSISGRGTSTSFGEIGDLQQTVNKLLAQALGEKIDLAALANAQATQSVNVGGINITIEGSASEETAAQIAAAVSEVLNKEIGNKDTLLASGVV